VSRSERVGEVREILDSTTVGISDANVSTTLVRNPALFRRWIPFGTAVMNGTLPARERELLILRTGWNCRAPYEWAQHSLIALRVGIRQEEIDRVASDRAEDQSDRGRQLFPLIGFGFELGAASCGQFVKLGFAAGLGISPFRREQTPALQPMQRRI